MVVLIWADQLLPQFLLELFGTLPSQYKHTLGMCMKKYYFENNIFDKISAVWT